MGIPERIEAIRKGENPPTVCRMSSGWLVFCDWQFLPGYVILLADPPVPSLNDLTIDEGQQFLHDMRIAGDAVLEVTGAVRINYQILCNLEPYLHAHICPRYAWEAEEMRKRPTAHYDKSQGRMFDLERDRALMEKVAAAVNTRS